MRYHRITKPPSKRISEEEGKRGEDGMSNELRTIMAGIDMGGKEMDEDEGEEAKQDVVEAKEGGLRGGVRNWKPQGS